MTFRRLTEADVEFDLRCEPEEIPFRGNCSALDPETDLETEEWIADQLESGNPWAWCQVEVTARWKGFEGRFGLGGCSYESEESFSQPGGYFDDLKAEALDDLNTKVEAAGKALVELEVEHAASQ